MLKENDANPDTRQFASPSLRWLVAGLLAPALSAGVWLIAPSGETPASNPAGPDNLQGTAISQLRKPPPGALPAAPMDELVTRGQPADAAMPGAGDVRASNPEPDASARPVDGGQAQAPGSVDVAEVADDESVLFITIIGEQTYYHWGRVGDRPPRIDQPGAPGAGFELAVPAPGNQVADANVSSAAEATETPAEISRGPAPQECPRTLPPGSDQSVADNLRAQSGCLYLSSCSVENKECSWHYQGRG